MLQKLHPVILSCRYLRANGDKLSIFHQHRLLSYYVNKIRTFECMKNDDSALQAEFKRAQFLVFFDKQPLLKKSAQTSRYSLAWIGHDRIKNVALKHGFSLGPDNTALIDTVPMQSHTNDTDEEWLPVLTLGIRSNRDLQTLLTDAKLAEDLGGGEFVDLRRALFVLDDSHNAQLLAKAQAILRWASVNKFCAKCSSPLKLKISKAFATCTSCSSVYYPTVSPVAISLISDEKKEHVLLVRQPMHITGMFTAVAGFCETGESLEQTVRREIAEEVGVDVIDIKYASLSQPWPFPQSSLMVAFNAIVPSLQEPDVDKSELEDAAWFSRQEVSNAFENTLSDSSFMKSSLKNVEKFLYVPPYGTLAHDLIKRWLLEKP